MGLLSDPSLSTRSKFGRTLAKYNRNICLLFYVAGIIWFIVIAHKDFNHSTYLSENALSPGLVYPEIKQDSARLAQTLLEELQRERLDNRSITPFAWIIAKMKQIGLETHTHNFTLHYPYGGGRDYYGKNIYGILRAPRLGSTEGIVFSAPYRPPTSIHTDITASVPVLLAFAEFARKKNYWAKDLIFLVTEQEQLGMHAWLEAYHLGSIQTSTLVNFGNLPARAGALQAALNLEIQDLEPEFIDVKIEGLNGQLPNLDMFNLVQRITAREGVQSGYKQGQRKKRRVNQPTIEANLKNMFAMLMSQATGVPNGNHGLYHRHRIESLTIEAVKRTTNSNSRSSTSLPLLKTIEGISRSLNNLLERFHQSYFFYILVQNDRFVSIGDFMPCLILLVGPMFIKAFLLWLTIDDNGEDDENVISNPNDNVTTGINTINANDVNDNDADADVDADDNDNNDIKQRKIITAQNDTNTIILPYGTVFAYIAVVILLGVLCLLMPKNQNIRDYFTSYGINTPITISILLIILMAISLIIPFNINLQDHGMELLHVATLNLQGVSLIVIGLLNFSLGFIIAIITSPLSILITTTNTKPSLRQTITKFYTFLLNPYIFVYLIVFVMTLAQFPELTLMNSFGRALTATMDAITFALTDNVIYGNWLYTVCCIIFFPIWMLLWTLAICKQPKVLLETKLKTN